MRLSRTASLALLLALLPAARADEKPIDFSRDVRPILADNCFACHGPDPGQRKAHLRLDTRAGAVGDRGGYAAVVPGKPDDSEVYLRITSPVERERMPPRKSGKTLSPAQIAVLRKWIAQGARWEEHWAFTPPTRPKVPAVKDPSWVRNPIDAFVLARLEREGLAPSPPADRITLLRRLSLDLVGLPPAVPEVDAFVADDSPEAYTRRVEQMLASPAHGERWGRRWLDAARYADSDGFEKDKPREVWFYRDWVIAALNRDLPYNRFIVEQIAGDLLPDATQDQIVATGFLRNSMINEEGGVDPEQFRMEAMFDRMDAVGLAVLGLTVRCAQCHDHKYDPLTQRDYYRMFAYLNNSHEARVTVYTPEQQKKRSQVLRRIRALEDSLQKEHPDWRERMAQWEENLRAEARPTWRVAELTFDEKTIGGQKFLPQEDGSYLAQSYAPTKFRPKMTLETDLKKITAVRLELLTDPNLPHGGPGRSIEGTCALSEFEVEAGPADGGKMKKVKIARATADFSPPTRPLKPIYDDRSKKKRVTGPITFAIDGKEETAWGTDTDPGRRNQARKAVFVFDKPIENPAGSALAIYLTQKHGGWNSDDNQTHNIGRFRISLTDHPNPHADPLPRKVRKLLSIPREKRTPEQVRAIFRYWRTTVPEWKAVNDKIEALWREHPEGASQLVLMERDTPRITHRLQRGDFLKPEEVVEPGVPAFLHPLPAGEPNTRLTFARWLVDPRSPTTARAIVNRVWQGYFGTGLVATSEDLGSQGEAPSNPELLDWLAVEFMEGGWSLKHLHRLIVTSSTYQQSSHVSPDLLRRDPDNRLLARGPRVRVEAEVVRDVALSAGGLLYRKMGGPSVYPPAPDFLFKPPASYGPKTWKKETGPDRYRRALYTFRFRSVPHPALEVFDAPPGESACVRRPRSNTPLQALTTLNEPLFLDCARGLAWHTLRAGGASDEARLTHAFRRCVSRKPTNAESVILLDLLARQKRHFAREGADPWSLAAPDAKSRPALPAGVSPADAAAWTAVARVLLNLDETITKE